MNFLEKIKEDLGLSDMPHRPLRSPMGRDYVSVHWRELIQLLEDYERLDGMIRLEYNEKIVSLPHRLHDLLKEIVLNNGHGRHEMMQMVHETLKPIMEERIKLKEAEIILNRR